MMLVKCLVLLLLYQTDCLAEIIVSVHDVSVYMGESATIPCNYTTDIHVSGSPTISWYNINGERKRTRLYTFNKSNASVTGSNSNISSKLDIGPNGELIVTETTNVEKINFYTLICEVQFNATVSNESKLNFIVSTAAIGEPIANIGSPEYTSNGLYQLIGSCVSGYGFPEPVVDFYRGDRLVPDPPSTVFKGTGPDLLVTGRSDDGLLIKTTKLLVVNVTGEDDNASYCCVVSSGVNREVVQFVTMPLFRVKYPTNNVKITANKYSFLEGEILNLNCKANGNPPSRIVDFGGQMSSTYSKAIVASDNGKEVNCTAQNSLGPRVVATYTITVVSIKEPTITGNPVVTLGSSLVLTCSALSNQDVTYRWLKDEIQTQVAKATYSIDAAGFRNGGKYTCNATNTMGIHKVTSVQVTVNGIAAVSHSVKKSGKMAVLSCTVESHPTPTVVWTRVGTNSTVEGANLTSDMNLFTSTLVVGPLDASFKDVQYKCSATNYAVPDEVLTLTLDFSGVEITDSSTTTYIIIGVVAGLLVLVAVTLAVLHNKRIICSGTENAETTYPVSFHSGEVETGHISEEETLMDVND